MSEHAVYFRPAAGVEALQARFVEHAYMPHSHPTWTVAVVHHGAAQFEVDATHYLALLVQPVLVFEGTAAKLQTVRDRAERRGVPIALYTTEMFTTGHDASNRAAVPAVTTAELDIVGVALRAPHRDADAVLRGLDRHP